MPLNIDDLSFSGNNPGAARFGNFINYYSFHSSKERIKNLDTKMFPLANGERIHCLDIGCNSGELTEELYVYLKNVYSNLEIKILAIDIDPTLIKRAQERNANRDILFATSDITTEMGHKLIKDYIQNENKNKFDIIFCFSVTMWIHINNGDSGLQNMLKFVKVNSRSIIIEPQPWKCYKNAQRRMKRSGKCFELFNSLQVRDDVDKVIENILTDDTYVKVYESSPSSWNRIIQSYFIKE